MVIIYKKGGNYKMCCFASSAVVTVELVLNPSLL